MINKKKHLVHPSFPPQGEAQPAHVGSQSMPPPKGLPDPYGNPSGFGEENNLY